MSSRDASVIRGAWRGSVRNANGWQEVRDATKPYKPGGLIEWGSITKGATAAAVEAAIDGGLIRDDTPVSEILPELDMAIYTVRDLIEHTSGLPRSHEGMSGGIFVDPYQPIVGVTLHPQAFRPTGAPKFSYSNLGYALLGAVLDRTSGDWWQWCDAHVLSPAGIVSATLAPSLSACTTPKTWRGRAEKPWPIGQTLYAPAGGIWSTFDDLIRFAEWSLGDRRRRTGWRTQGDAIWVNGQTRSSGACILAFSDEKSASLVHALAKGPYAADKIALRLLRKASPLSRAR